MRDRLSLITDVCIGLAKDRMGLAVIGIALVKGTRGLGRVQWGRVGGIVAGWVATPVVAGVICFFSLFVMQNVFDQPVYAPVEYQLTRGELQRLAQLGLLPPPDSK